MTSSFGYDSRVDGDTSVLKYPSASYQWDMAEARSIVTRMLVAREPLAQIVWRARALYRQAHLVELERVREQRKEDEAERRRGRLRKEREAREALEAARAAADGSAA